MGKRSTRVIAVIGATAVLVVGIDAISYAANGQSLILGKSNKASKVTEVKRTKSGPALKLTTKKPSNPPFQTNGTGKVVNLNADKVDGIDGTALNSKASAALAAGNDVKALRFKDTSNRGGNVTYNIGAIPKGTYSVTFNASVLLNTAGTPAAPNLMNCNLYNNNVLLDSTARGIAVGVSDIQIAPTFSTVVTTTGAESFRLNCQTTTGDGWKTSYTTGVFPLILFVSGEGPTLTFTKLDGVTDKTLAP